MIGLVVLLLFGGRLLAWVRALVRRVIVPIALLLLVVWLVTSGEAQRIINHIG